MNLSHIVLVNSSRFLSEKAEIVNVFDPANARYKDARGTVTPLCLTELNVFLSPLEPTMLSIDSAEKVYFA